MARARGCQPGPRYPWAPIQAYLDVHLGEVMDEHGQLIGASSARAAVYLGAHQRQIQRWKAEGLTLDSADRVATALGRHVDHFWSDDDAVRPRRRRRAKAAA